MRETKASDPRKQRRPRIRYLVTIGNNTNRSVDAILLYSPAVQLRTIYTVYTIFSNGKPNANLSTWKNSKTCSSCPTGIDHLKKILEIKKATNHIKIRKYHDEKIPRGRPKKRRMDEVNKDLEKSGESAKESRQSRGVEISVGGGNNSWRVMIPARRRKKNGSEIAVRHLFITFRIIVLNILNTKNYCALNTKNTNFL